MLVQKESELLDNALFKQSLIHANLTHWKMKKNKDTDIFEQHAEITFVKMCWLHNGFETAK